MKKLLLCIVSAFLILAPCAKAAEQLPCQRLIPELADACKKKTGDCFYDCVLIYHETNDSTFTEVTLVRESTTSILFRFTITIEDGGYIYADDNVKKPEGIARGYKGDNPKYEHINADFNALQNRYQAACSTLQKIINTGPIG